MSSDRDFQGVNSNRDQKPAFSVMEPFQGTITININYRMSILLQQFIQDIEGDVEPEIWAFRKALQNPAAGREIRQAKLERRNGGQDEEAPRRVRRPREEPVPDPVY